MSDYLQKLDESLPLRKPVLKKIIDYIQLPKQSKGIDVGCGYGAQAILLAKAVGENGHITGLDLSSEFLEYGREIVQTGVIASLRNVAKRRALRHEKVRRLLRPFVLIPRNKIYLFVVGCYNSGTTLLADILSHHPSVWL